MTRGLRGLLGLASILATAACSPGDDAAPQVHETGAPPPAAMGGLMAGRTAKGSASMEAASSAGSGAPV